MNTHRKSSTALAAVMAMILAVPSALWAAGPDENGDQGGNNGGNKTNEHYNIHNNIHSNNHYDGPYANNGPYHPGYYPRAPYHPGYYAKGPSPHYYPHYYPGHYPQYYPAPPCTNCGKNNHHNNNNNDSNDKLWIGLLGGGILGYGLNAYQHSNTADQGNAPTAMSAPPPPGPTQYATTAPVSPCLQQREYSTKIMVGGKQVNGYGTVCLQPDGSWRYGATQPERY